MNTKIIRIPTSVKSWFLQPLSHQMLGFEPQTVQIQTLKSCKKVTWKPAGTKNMYFDPRSPKSYQNGVPKSKVESHFAYSTGIFSYSTGKCSYSTGIRARAPDPNPSETPAVTSKVMQSCPKVTKTHQYWTQDSTEFQHLRKIGFCNTFHTKCLFLEPQTSRFRP